MKAGIKLKQLQSCSGEIPNQPLDSKPTADKSQVSPFSSGGQIHIAHTPQDHVTKTKNVFNYYYNNSASNEDQQQPPNNLMSQKQLKLGDQGNYLKTTTNHEAVY